MKVNHLVLFLNLEVQKDLDQHPAEGKQCIIGCYRQKTDVFNSHVYHACTIMYLIGTGSPC